MNGTGAFSRLRTRMDGYDASELYVESGANVDNSGGYLLVTGVPSGTHTFNVYNTLEPGYVDSGTHNGLTFVGFETDGAIAAPSPALSRSIEFLGDSITAGFGSTGTGPCPAGAITNDNSRTYGAYLCANFSANCSIIAWSGKGMYENCCDDGERMPQYFLQTLGGEDYSQDWDFNRFIPQAMVINLGTNDFGHNHDNGPAWEAAFIDTYVQFLVNVTTMYYKSAPPTIFIAEGPIENPPALYTCLQNITVQANALGIKAHYLDMRNLPCDGCDGHPGPIGHEAMFQAAQPQIASVMGW